MTKYYNIIWCDKYVSFILFLIVSYHVVSYRNFTTVILNSVKVKGCVQLQCHAHLKLSKWKESRHVHIFLCVHVWREIVSFHRENMNTSVARFSPAALQQLPSTETLSAEMESLKRHLSQVDSPTVLCHNDLLTKNIIYDHKEGEGKTRRRWERIKPLHELFLVGYIAHLRRSDVIKATEEWSLLNRSSACVEFQSDKQFLFLFHPSHIGLSFEPLYFQQRRRHRLYAYEDVVLLPR